MRLKRIGLTCAVVFVMAACTGCSSPYFPHNAFKYIPEFRANENSATGEEPKEDVSEENPMERSKSYFSPASIRERYSQHVQNLSAEDNDLLLEIAKDTVALMREDGKSEDDIRSALKDKYHFSNEIIDKLVQ